MSYLSNKKVTEITFQLSLAVLYVVIIRQFLAVSTPFWGIPETDLTSILRILLATGVGIAVIFTLNFLTFKTDWFRLSWFIGVVIFIYYYIYNPYGRNYVLLYLSIVRSPVHLINMFLLIGSPVLFGLYLRKKSI